MTILRAAEKRMKDIINTFGVETHQTFLLTMWEMMRASEALEKSARTITFSSPMRDRGIDIKDVERALAAYEKTGTDGDSSHPRFHPHADESELAFSLLKTLHSSLPNRRRILTIDA